MEAGLGVLRAGQSSAFLFEDTHLLPPEPGSLQGGDGLVAARHLWHFGYNPYVRVMFYAFFESDKELHRTLFYPKQGKNEFYQRLLKQCSNLGISEIGSGGGDSAEAAFEEELQKTDLVMDAIFGFSFEGEPRPPFDKVITALKQTKKPIVSVDIPSAWNVEKGDPEGKYFTPGGYLLNEAPVGQQSIIPSAAPFQMCLSR